MDSQTLPTHSVPFLFLLIQTIFAIGRCCNLSTRSTRRNTLPIAHNATTHIHTHARLLPVPLLHASCAIGRCCNLSTRSTRRHPLPIAPTATALLYTYSTSYDIYYCHHRHVSLLLLPLPL